MTVFAVLLRGINVGGRNRLAMADLRALGERLGFSEPRTYLQSGNLVVFDDHDDPDAVAAAFREGLVDDLGLQVTVLVRTGSELRSVEAASPFPSEALADPTTVHAAFLSAPPSDPDRFEFDPATFAPERAVLGDRVLYLHLPDGMARSRLASALARREGEVEVTLRNWRTVARLAEMTEETST